jgi:hypothetical protein
MTAVFCKYRKGIVLAAILVLVAVSAAFCKGEGSGSHPFTGLSAPAACAPVMFHGCPK